MTKHAFLEGMGLGVLAGAAIGMAVAARGMQNPDVRRAARKAGRRMSHMKAELADTMAMCGAHTIGEINRSMIYGY